MKLGLPTFLRTTTFKLALLYSAMFAAFSAALLIYLYYSTVYYIRTESDRRILYWRHGAVEPVGA